MSQGNLQPKTRKGQATKNKMIEAAAQLMHANGVHSTTVNDVLSRSKTGKSQFSHYFGSKESLVREVIEFHRQQVIEMELNILNNIQRLADFQSLSDFFVRGQENFLNDYNACCPLGQIILEEKGDNIEIQNQLKACFSALEDGVTRCLKRLVSSGELNQECPCEKLARTFVTVTQGASVIGKLKQSSEPMEEAIGQFLDCLEGYQSTPAQ